MHWSLPSGGSIRIKSIAKKVRAAMTSDASVRAYVVERFGTEDADIAAIALVSALVEYCGVDIQVEG